MHRALSYLLVLHGSIAVPPTHLHSAPSGVLLYQVAAHAPFVASFSSFVFGVVHCTVLATSRCNNGSPDVSLHVPDRFDINSDAAESDVREESTKGPHRHCD